MNQPRHVLITGAAGRMGSCLRELLPAHGYRLRSFDRLPVPGEPEAVVADLRDTEALAAAMDGVDAVVHLAGIPGEAPFADILAANIDGTYRLYEAARAAGVRRVVYASSNHATGFTERPADGSSVPVDAPARPDTYYGVSKCFGESLASLYADRHGIETVSLRIGSFTPEPRSVRMLSTWLSPADWARLAHAALTGPVAGGHTVVYGISANTRAWWDLSSARALGYRPQDDAEAYAPELIAKFGELPADDPEFRYLGGSFTQSGR
ncbi:MULTISPECIES: NAD-dependent epimerase/dehydratase family protein [unclassified Streptomyces]|uniref:NAD-dependent epimerase/dehydratase family protein n=1 Tax=unclassified Streptomyces TaxID=2593676 RepID=UPI000BE3B07B|nr:MULTISPECIES: NAD(P)-dependent oxidoreductase [unclassified Streptomyces]